MILQHRENPQPILDQRVFSGSVPVLLELAGYQHQGA